MDRLTVVSPYIFVVSYIGYIVLGLLFFPLVSTQFTVYRETFLFIGIGMGFYIGGCQFVLPDKRKVYFFVTAVVVTFYAYQEYSLWGLVIPVVGLVLLRSVNNIKVEYLVLAGILLLILELVTKGVPLFDPELRKGYADPIFIFGYALLFLGLAFMVKSYNTKYVIALFLGSVGLLSLFTYRVYVLELVIVVFISLYMLKKIQVIHIALSVIPLFLLILFVGYTGVAYQEWELNPVNLFFFRPAFTFGVLNKIVHEAGYFGIFHGRIWLQFTCGTVMGEYLFGYNCNITSTILGPLIFDGGIFGLGLMAFFGAAANTLYRKAVTNELKVPYYAIVMAMFLVGVDVSFIPSIVLLFFAGLYLVSD